MGLSALESVIHHLLSREHLAGIVSSHCLKGFHLVIGESWQVKKIRMVISGRNEFTEMIKWDRRMLVASAWWWGQR